MRSNVVSREILARLIWPPQGISHDLILASHGETTSNDLCTEVNAAAGPLIVKVIPSSYGTFARLIAHMDPIIGEYDAPSKQHSFIERFSLWDAFLQLLIITSMHGMYSLSVLPETNKGRETVK